MKISKYFFVIILILQGCVVQFQPVGGDAGDNIVVDGLLTDQNNSYKVKIFRSSPLGTKFTNNPVKGCLVIISDDLGNQYPLKENKSGMYFSDSLTFRGVAGRKYTLHISTGSHTYESTPMELKPVPPVDSLYANIIYKDNYVLGETIPGYQIYVNTHDQSDGCRFYRWDFTETWEITLRYISRFTENITCWTTVNSNKIYIKNTSALTENKVLQFPLNFVTTETERLVIKYSLLLRQYSLNEAEYNYWEKLKKINEDVGSLYDAVPMSVESNMYCTDSPAEKVLGFFHVSSVGSKRIFIKNKTLTRFPGFYEFCPADTIPQDKPIPFLNSSVFILEEILYGPPTFEAFYVLTNFRECVDCTVNGSNKRPDYWGTDKNDVVIQSELK